MMNDDDLQISDPAEIAEVDRFGSDPEFLQHDGCSGGVDLPSHAALWEPHGKERYKEREESSWLICCVSPPPGGLLI
jgi:hypothetical protein